MKNDEYMQTCFENIITIMKVVGTGVAMMGAVTIMNGYDNDDAKRRGMQQILKGSSMVAFFTFSTPVCYEWYFQKAIDNEIKKTE